ncbi:unnamed protein product [Scytosiphon promiscuus]
MAPRASTGGGGSGGCLEGKVFGLTGELPRKELAAELRTHGAKVSATIHKRVSFVLCTDDAVKYSTQRVRKALKHGIPLVSQGFVAACALAGGPVDPAPFRATADVAKPPAGTTAKPSASKSPLNNESDAPTPSKLADVDGGESASPLPEASTAVVVVTGEAETTRPERGAGGADATRGDASEKRPRRRRQKGGEPAPTEDVRLGGGERQAGLSDGGGDCGGSGGDTGGCTLDGTKRKKKRKAGRNRGEDASRVIADPCPGAEGEACRGEHEQKDRKNGRGPEKRKRKDKKKRSLGIGGGARAAED